MRDKYQQKPLSQDQIEELLSEGQATLMGTAIDWKILDGEGNKYWRIRVNVTESDLLALRETSPDWWEKYGKGELK